MAKKSDSPFGQILAALLEEKKIGAREAARIAQVPASTLASWLRGHTPGDFQAVRRLALHLETTLSFLLTGQDESERQVPPSLAELFQSRGLLFDGFLKVRIEHIAPRNSPTIESATDEQENPDRGRSR